MYTLKKSKYKAIQPLPEFQGLYCDICKEYLISYIIKDSFEDIVLLTLNNNFVGRYICEDCYNNLED